MASDSSTAHESPRPLMVTWVSNICHPTLTAVGPWTQTWRLVEAWTQTSPWPREPGWLFCHVPRSCLWSGMPPRALSYLSVTLLQQGTVLSPETVWRLMTCAPTDCEEHGGYFCCPISNYRRTVEREGGAWKTSVTPLIPHNPSLPKSNSLDQAS